MITINNDIKRIDSIPVQGKDIVVAIEIAELTLEEIKKIGEIVLCIARELKIFPNVTIVELGDRSVQAFQNGIYPENYDSVEMWLDDILRDDWGYNPEKNKNDMDIKNMIIGIGVVASYLIDKLQDLPINDFLMLAPNNSEFFTLERVLKIISLIKENSIAFHAIVRFLSGNDKSKGTVELATDALIMIEKSLDSALNDNEAYERVVSYCTQ